MATSTHKKSSFWDRLMGNPKVRKVMDEAAAEEAGKDPAAKPASKDNPRAAQAPQSTDSVDLEQLTAKLDELTLMVRALTEQAGQSADSDPAEDDDSVDDDDPTTDDDPVGDEDPTTDEGPEDPAKKTGDRALRRRTTADADTVRRARVLAPALRARVGDAAAAVKRAALRSAMRDARVKKTVDALLRGTSLVYVALHYP